jgi:hypothetical protein
MADYPLRIGAPDPFLPASTGRRALKLGGEGGWCGMQLASIRPAK